MTLSNFDLTQQQQKYLNVTLNKTARTFALLPPFIDPILAEIMSLAYLVCRVVDNVEDCDQPFAWKAKRFREVRQLLNEPKQAQSVLLHWATLDWPGLNAHETALMTPTDGSELWQIYGMTPRPFRQTINRWVSEMAFGMEATLNPAVAPHTIQIENITILQRRKDYDKYCYYVAGTVGYLQTELIETFYELSDDIVASLKKHCLSFGLGLQKTNIVKDFLDDLNRGICYLPNSWLSQIQHQPFKVLGATSSWVHYVLSDVKGALDEAAEYIGALPYSLAGVRQATLMCLLPAYKTILLAAEKSNTLFTAEHRLKISRTSLAECFDQSSKMAQENSLLWDYREQVDEQFHHLMHLPLDAKVNVG